jgi:uncharacterized protein YndB with AHSA1/START domain
MNAQPLATVRVTRRFDFPPERVFGAWLDPRQAQKFLFATPGSEMVRVEIDARVNGRFTIVERRDGEEAGHYGTYLEIDPPRRLVFDFSVDLAAADPTRVTVEIVPVTGGCELTLTHERVWANYADRTRAGWTTILEGLADTLARRNPDGARKSYSSS